MSRLRAWSERGHAVDRAAVEAGNSPLCPEVWECKLPGTGEVVSLVRTEAEAHHVVARGRVFTLAQIAALIAKIGRSCMTYWTPKMVEARWPKRFPRWDSRPRNSLNRRVPLLLKRVVRTPRCSGSCGWQPEDAQLLWMRVERTPWKDICQHFVSRERRAHDVSSTC